MTQVDGGIEIKKALDLVTHLALLYYAKENNIGFGYAPEHPSFDRPDRLYLYLEIYHLETDEEAEALDKFLSGLDGEFAYGKDCYWFLVEGGDK